MVGALIGTMRARAAAVPESILLDFSIGCFVALSIAAALRRRSF